MAADDLGFLGHRMRPGRGRVLVARTDRRTVGTVLVSWAPADEAEIRTRFAGVPIMYWLRVDHPYRRRGIGTRLIRAAERMLREQGHRRVLIGVDQANVLARKLYVSLGYRAEMTGLPGDSGPYDILVGDL